MTHNTRKQRHMAVCVTQTADTIEGICFAFYR